MIDAVGGQTHTTVPLARIDIGSISGSIQKSVRIGGGGGDSTRLTRIRTDFWNDVGSERNASESGPFRSVPFRSDISFQWNHLVRILLYILLCCVTTFIGKLRFMSNKSVITDITLQLKMYLYFTSL